MNFKKVNNITGWIVFAIASSVFIMTREATVSFWDCGEFISCAYKLQISHPPGAPLFILLGRLFIILFGGTPHTAATKVNLLSSLSSGFTILFLFWSITHLAKKLMVKKGEIFTTEKMIAIIGAGVVGALAFTFSDSFWFSAVEGIVFGVSPLFIALAFWAILKWEEEADQPHADRWIIFIAYMIGLSIGVHLLSLLSIPAIVMTYYFRRHKYSRNGMILAFLSACLITGAVQILVIQDTVKLIGWFDLIFVNVFGLPFNSGAFFCIFLFILLIVFGLRWAKKAGKYFIHMALLCFAFMLIGYSTYFIILIRANANPAINMQNVNNPIELVAYLDRSQYGSWPILYGQDFTAKPSGDESTGNIYYKDEKNGTYDVVGKKFRYKYHSADLHLFPRVWDSDNSQGHADYYRSWLNLGVGEAPSFADNIKWLIGYQFNWMYWRYFMWNFAGRQNDLQGLGNVRDGNWISGIPFIDNLRLGDQSKMPDSLKNNKAHNKLYFLPLILGILGLVFQMERDKKNALVVFLLYFFTGIAIILYLNQAGPQPRERDYSYVGSFYAFSIWIGLGVLYVYELFKKMASGRMAAISAFILCLLSVPVLMGFQEWNDHDRSHKTLARDTGADYLNSCAPNAILFTGGDNDTYPLWYAQEVEGIRPDVRVIVTSLLGTDWFINELRNKVNQSAPIPMSWSPDKYLGDNRNYVPYYDPGNIPKDKFFNLNDVMSFLGSDQYRIPDGNGDSINYLPTHNLFIPVNKAEVLANGTVLERDSAFIVPQVDFTCNKTALFKNDLAELNIIAANNWKRPIYFTQPTDLGLNDYLEQDGLTYRLVPVKKSSSNPDVVYTGNVNTPVMYNNLMYKFKFGGCQIPGTYFDEPNRRMLLTIRRAFATLGTALASEGKKDSAIQVLNYGDSMINRVNFPYGLVSNEPSNVHDITSLQYAYAYYTAGD
ncbi:MAG: glycosyltransferase family 117 protein, partial [Chitinophagaceae bacterium]